MQARSGAGAFALAAALAGIGAGAGAAIAATPAHHASAAPAVHYYVALGDSLSVGYQPNTKGVGVETKQGYANDLYAAARRHIKNLKLVEFGCPGATTTSLLTGKGNAAAARLFHCTQTGGSQLAAAEAFLRSHDLPGEVPFLTLDIGANDVDACASDATAGLGAVAACVSKGVKSISTNTPKILAGLKHAAAKGTALDAMNLYDPVLADELSSDSNTRTLGTVSLTLVKQVNATIQKADARAGFRTANVAKVFDTYNQTPVPTAGTPLASSGMSSVPTDVANICTFTWMCAAPPVGPNIHANAKGYALISDAFKAVLPKRITG